MIVRFYRWLMKEPEPCSNCEMLRLVLATEQFEKKQLLQSVLELTKPVVETKPEKVHPDELKPILPTHIPWRVRQQMLEQEDRVKAKIINEKKLELESIAKLEKDLGVNTDADRTVTGISK